MAPMSDPDLWYVMLADGDVHRVSLDQLDEAFQAGHIDQETLVLAAGATQWTALGKLAGLDETPPPPKVPVTTSFRPVSMDLGEVDIGDIRFREPTGKRWLAGLSALAVVGTLAGVAITQPGWARPAITTAGAYVSRAVHRALPWAPVATTAPASRLPAEPIDAASNPAAAPVPLAGSSVPAPGSSTTNPVSSAAPVDRFSSDLKQKLLEADKQRDLRAKARARSITITPSHHSAKNSFGGFTTGGNKFDPLNSAIP
jgi:hypothetical protein